MTTYIDCAQSMPHAHKRARMRRSRSARRSILGHVHDARLQKAHEVACLEPGHEVAAAGVYDHPLPLLDAVLHVYLQRLLQAKGRSALQNFSKVNPWYILIHKTTRELTIESRCRQNGTPCAFLPSGGRPASHV
jgi:hypothetical protein